WNQNTIQQLAKQIFAQKAEDYNDILIGLVTVYLYTTDSGLKERILLLFKALDEEYGTTIKSEMKPMRNTHPAIFNTVAGSSMGIFYGLVTYRLWKYLQLKQTLGLPKLYDRLGLTKAYEKIAIQLYSWRRALQAKLVLKKTKNPCLNAFQTIAAHLAQEEAVIQGAGQGALTLGEEVAQAHQMMQKLGKSWALVPVMATMGLGISYETYATWQFHKQQEKMNPHAVETTAQKLEQLKVLAQEIELYDSLKQQYKVIGENLKDYSLSDAPEVGQAIFDPIIDITRQIGTLNATYQAIKQARDAQLLKADLLNGADEIAFVDEIKERVLAVLPDDAQNKKLRDNLSKRIDQLNDHTNNFDQEFALLRDMYQVVVDTLTETDPNDPTSPESNINKVANYYGKHIQEYSRWLQAYYLELQAQEGPREAALILAHLAKQERSADTSDGAAAPSDDTPYLLDFVEGLLKIKAEDLTEAQEAQIWAMAQATPYLQKQFLPYFWLATAAGADLTDHPTVTMGGVENGVKLGIPVVIGASDLMNSCYVLENFARIPIVQYVIDKKAAAGHALKTTNPVQHQDLSAYLLQSYQNNSQDPVFKANDAASASAELSLSDFYQSIDNLLEDVDFWSEDRAAAEDAATDDAVDAEEDDADPADVLSGEDFIVLPPTSFDEAR
ncbi:MAG: hypothetical protein J6Y94_04435, partial [Bacteriovoracaceae bacterium]|nr:hypothetical protein [Bacteriovoracaceae bacterium]